MVGGEPWLSTSSSSASLRSEPGSSCSIVCIDDAGELASMWCWTGGKDVARGCVIVVAVAGADGFCAGCNCELTMAAHTRHCSAVPQRPSRRRDPSGQQAKETTRLLNYDRDGIKPRTARRCSRVLDGKIKEKNRDAWKAHSGSAT